MATTTGLTRNMAEGDIDAALELYRSKLDDFADFLATDLTESDTRSKLIDCMLLQVFGWSEQFIRREVKTAETNNYIDYLLSTIHPSFVIEAKRKTFGFDLPKQRNRHQYKIGGVISQSNNLKSAMLQARDYAVSKGVSFCCVSNGIEFVFFRAQNDSGIEWGDQIAVVFRDQEDILGNFPKFYHLFSYDSHSNGAVQSHLPVTDRYDEEGKKFKRLDVHQFELSRTRERNRLFLPFKEMIRKVFQDLAEEEADIEVLKNCYVESPRDSSYEKSLGGLLQNKPITRERTMRPLRVGRKDAGEFGETFAHTLEVRDAGEVVLLLGSIGVGKTTFIQRFRKVLARDRIDEACLWSYVDFRGFSKSTKPMLTWVSEKMLNNLAEEHPELSLDDYALLKLAYHKEYEQLKRGRLRPIYEQSPEDFEIKFSEQLAEYERNADEHSQRLITAAATKYNRRPVMVFDNADHFDADIQNEVFLIAQKLSREVVCPLILSLREESYWKNKEYGALGAFHSTSYYVRPPRLASVISKRLKYVKALIRARDEGHGFVDSDLRLIEPDELLSVVDQVSQTILGQDRRYITCLESLSPGELRRALEHLARFFYSGHTNMDALLKAAREGREITVGFHEFLTSLILGDHEYYQEASSDILNLFSADGRGDASNLNRIAVLGVILKYKDESTHVGTGFVPIEKVIGVCEQRMGILPETCKSILSLLNRLRLIETETQIRDKLIASTNVRCTAAASYYIEQLGTEFAYLDVILSDTPIAAGNYFERIQRLTSEIHELSGKKGNIRVQRLEKRIERGRVFVNYLINEYANSTIKEASEEMSPVVDNFFNSVHGKYTSEAHKIIDRAKTLLVAGEP